VFGVWCLVFRVCITLVLYLTSSVSNVLLQVTGYKLRCNILFGVSHNIHLESNI